MSDLVANLAGAVRNSMLIRVLLRTRGIFGVPGLFAILAAVMYLTRTIDWDSLGREPPRRGGS